MLASQGPVPHSQAQRDPAVTSLSPGAERRHDERMPPPDLLPHIPQDPEGWVPVAIAMATPLIREVNHLGCCCLPAHPTLAPAALPTEAFAGWGAGALSASSILGFLSGRIQGKVILTLVTCCSPQRPDG